MTVQVNFGTVESMADAQLLRCAEDKIIAIEMSSSDTGGLNAQILAETYLKEIQSRGLMAELVQRLESRGVDGITVGNA